MKLTQENPWSRPFGLDRPQFTTANSPSPTSNLLMAFMAFIDWEDSTSRVANVEALHPRMACFWGFYTFPTCQVWGHVAPCRVWILLLFGDWLWLVMSNHMALACFRILWEYVLIVNILGYFKHSSNRRHQNKRGNRTNAPGHCYAHSRCVLALPALPMGVATIVMERYGGTKSCVIWDDGYPIAIQNVQLVHKVLLTISICSTK